MRRRAKLGVIFCEVFATFGLAVGCSVSEPREEPVNTVGRAGCTSNADCTMAPGLVCKQATGQCILLPPADAAAGHDDADSSDERIPDAGGDGQSPYDGSEGPIAPTGCRLVSTGLRAGRKAESLPRPEAPDAVGWNSPTNAMSEDDLAASVTLDDGQESAELRVSDFGVALPAAAETWGIEAVLRRRASGDAIEDALVTLAVAGKKPGSTTANKPWPTDGFEVHRYGQPVDAWRLDLFPADVTAEAFAVRIWVRKRAGAPSGPITAYVDSLRVAVWYCLE